MRSILPGILLEHHPASVVGNPFEEQALEVPLRINDILGSMVTVSNLGKNLLREVVKKPHMMGADVLILLEDGALGVEGKRLTKMQVNRFRNCRSTEASKCDYCWENSK